MIIGAHTILYSKKADAVREFLGDVLGFPSVDAGGGWPIFRSPPAELAVHPADEEAYHELYFMVDDIDETIRRLAARGIQSTPIMEQHWGRLIQIALPDGEPLGVYQPLHPTAIALQEAAKAAAKRPAAKRPAAKRAAKPAKKKPAAKKGPAKKRPAKKGRRR